MARGYEAGALPSTKIMPDQAGKLRELPAGGNAVGAFIGAALIVFLVLLLTDILGYTDVFPFVKKHK